LRSVQTGGDRLDSAWQIQTPRILGPRTESVATKSASNGSAASMPRSLPPEILDLIVDHLHTEPTTLRACCVVSKSWIHRTRTHLFAHIKFDTSNCDIERWKKAFPDSSSSPAHYTRHLLIRGLSAVTAADAGGWTRAFHNLVHLQLEGVGGGDRVSLIPFHGLSPTLRSLNLIYTSPGVLDLICSFPLLEDLGLVSPSQGSHVWNTPLTSPKLTGSLDLSMLGGIHPVARRLLSLPNGLHFTKITAACLDEGIHPVRDLVSRCSDTLESIDIFYYTPGTFPLAFCDWPIPYCL
jgi:hypothetical protein